MIHNLRDAIGPAKHQTVRPPAVAGRFYPAAATELEAMVRQLLASARTSAEGRVRAVIAPHAGYACSGEVAAAAYHTLASSAPTEQRAGETPVIYLLGPAHWRPVDGVGLPRAMAFGTPLGTVPVAADHIADLLHLGGQYKLNEAAHIPEHGLEVQLPFLQATLGDAPGAFSIVPMLFDDSADPERTAADLTALLERSPADLIVVSSDLSHYHSYQEAVILDHGLLKAIATSDIETANSGEACGLLPILCLMRVAQHFGWTPHLCAYANSGDTCGPRHEVVGYGAVVYTEV